MKWIRFTIQTTTDAEDIIISDLYDIGLEGAQIEDKIPMTPLEKEQMFVDILPETEEDDGVAYLSFFVESPEEETEKQALIEERKSAIAQALDGVREYMEIGSGEITVSETEDLDWINNWKQYFHQFTIDDDILVIPSWEDVEPQDKNKMILHIDPGTAFGTGMHETTQLCIRQLKKYVNAETRLLDVGTGSGILSILSLMFGAKEALGTDLDPCAIEAVADNLRTNGIDEKKFTLLIGNIINDPEIQKTVGDGYDIAAANILAEVLVPLIPVLPAHLKKGGILITSGIIEGKENLVADTMKANGFEVVDISAQGEWRSVTGRLV
ncbi:MAG: 50S ribosomal protein L11 methyltransferase [Lachnospiraceae bacterium]|nr:50S ribosomal protein L11 methyltransferase [Lachnospiraceae bacterium]MBR6156603.1 50S ribosomal protein L11 methyltransferase [Lachnospiraceae bacterium]